MKRERMGKWRKEDKVEGTGKWLELLVTVTVVVVSEREIGMNW